MSSHEAGWEWVDMDEIEYHFSLLDEAEQQAMLASLPAPESEHQSNRMPFDELIASMQLHTTKKGI